MKSLVLLRMASRAKERRDFSVLLGCLLKAFRYSPRMFLGDLSCRVLGKEIRRIGNS
jgi:hypothetical protein